MIDSRANSKPYFPIFAEKTQYNRVETYPKTTHSSCKEAKEKQDYVRGVQGETLQSDAEESKGGRKRHTLTH